MGTWRGLVAVAVAVLVGHPAQAEYVSWGKPGEGREAFETGSRACMLKTARRDVAQDRATQKYLRGFEVMERENNMPPMPVPPSDDPTFVRSERQVLLRRAYAPDRHTDTLQAQLQAEVDACLVQSGYVKFALTPGQERQLRRYRPGTEARKRYLYALGSDGRIVEAQKVGG